MKKFLVLVLALIMCLGCFASCTIEPQNPDNTPGGDDKTPTLATAADLLFSLYKDSAKENKGDYELVGNIKIGSTDFPVTWAVDTDLITIKASTKTNGFWTVDLPAKNDTAVNYKLTATIKDAAGNTATKVFDRTIGVYDSSDIVAEPVEGVAYKLFLEQNTLRKTLYATAALDQGKFIVGDVDPKKGIDFFAEKVEGGYKFYTTINDAKMYLHAHTEEKDDGKVSKFIGYAAESDNVWYYKADCKAWFVMLNGTEYVLGTYNSYATMSMSEGTFMTPDKSGVSQFPANFITKENAENKEIVDNSGNFDDGQVVTLEKFLEAANACEDKGAASTEKYIIEGKIVEVANDTYGNLYIENEAGTKVYVYGLYSADGKRYDAMDYKPQVGDTVKLYGSAGKYNNPQMPNATLISVTKGEGNQGGETNPPATGTLNAVTAPVADVAYKLFLNQVTTGKLLYATAELQNNKFIVGSETATEGLDFYAEVVTGGYKFYTTIGGAKVYLHAHTETDSDGKVSKFLTYEASSDLVWYYKAETNAWYVTINGAEYVLGTYQSFNTFSMSDSSFMKPDTTGVSQFPGAFATKEEAESLGGSTGGDQGGTEPTPPAEGVTSIADIKAAANGDFTAAGVVVGVNAQSFLLKDDTGLILVYLGYNWTPDVAVGDKLTVTGTTSEYAGVKQFGNKPSLATYTKNGTETVTHPTPTELSAADVDAYATMSTIAPLYVKVVATLAVSGNYYNLNVEGATTITGSITYPVDKDALNALNGQTVEVVGYVTGVVNAKFLNLMITSVNGNNAGGDDNQGGETPTPPAGTITNIADALAAAEGTEVVLTGTVTDIYYAWDDYYGNMSVWIQDDAGNRILAFRMGTMVQLGDNITVTGTITVYNETNQIAQGCTAVINSTAGGDDNTGDDDQGGSTTPAEGSTMSIIATEGTLASDKSNITWSNDTFTFTNNKASSRSDIRNSDENHFRCYVGSEVVIATNKG